MNLNGMIVTNICHKIYMAREEKKTEIEFFVPSFVDKKGIVEILAVIGYKSYYDDSRIYVKI